MKNNISISKIKRILVYITLIFLSLLFFTPIIMMIITSIKTPIEITNIFSLPGGIYTKNFLVAFDAIGRGIINSIIITIPGVALSVFLGAMAAYPLSQFKFKGDRIVYMILLLGLFIPFQILLIPLFEFVNALNIYNSYLGMWLIHGIFGMPLCTFYLRNYMATIPHALMESAMIDGCSIAGYFFRILLPLAKPGLGAVILLQTRGIWNDLLFGLTFTSSETVSPVTVQLANFIGTTSVQYGPLMAATIIAVIPPMLSFLIFKRSFIRGVLGGSLD